MFSLKVMCFEISLSTTNKDSYSHRGFNIISAVISEWSVVNCVSNGWSFSSNIFQYLDHRTVSILNDQNNNIS